MADCDSLLDEELSSFVFNYLTENSGSQVRDVHIIYIQNQDYLAEGSCLHVIGRSMRNLIFMYALAVSISAL